MNSLTLNAESLTVLMLARIGSKIANHGVGIMFFQTKLGSALVSEIAVSNSSTSLPVEMFQLICNT